VLYLIEPLRLFFTTTASDNFKLEGLDGNFHRFFRL
jgi:hypothetical protein